MPGAEVSTYAGADRSTADAHSIAVGSTSPTATADAANFNFSGGGGGGDLKTTSCVGKGQSSIDNTHSKDGHALHAIFYAPVALISDHRDDSLYVSDSMHHCIRRIAAPPDASSTGSGSGGGVVTTFAGKMGGASGNAISSPAGLLFEPIAATTATTAAAAAALDSKAAAAPAPATTSAVASDSLLVCEFFGVRRIDMKSGAVDTYVGPKSEEAGADVGQRNGPRFTATFNAPSAIAIDRKQNAFIADSKNHVIRRLDHSSGYVSTLCGAMGVSGYRDGNSNSSGSASAAAAIQFRDVSGVIVDPYNDNVLYVSDSNRIRKVYILTGTAEIDHPHIHIDPHHNTTNTNGGSDHAVGKSHHGHKCCIQ